MKNNRNSIRTLTCALASTLAIAAAGTALAAPVLRVDAVDTYNRAITGTAGPGETVRVSVMGRDFTATADESGRWYVDLPQSQYLAENEPISVRTRGGYAETIAYPAQESAE